VTVSLPRRILLHGISSATALHLVMTREQSGPCKTCIPNN